ncbi:MAG: SMC-Scp complex subunit ScpB [Bacteroidetes bacterium]|nr:SMC-Scp complex subunit ScpB [Bacteroidota bacterium]MDA0906852.1 SMC-Scp complex subunit ScpB [Bacteroidota bacterium]
MNYTFVDGTRLISVIEAILFAHAEPLKAIELAEMMNESEEELSLTAEHIDNMITELNQLYDQNDVSFRIEKKGGGYRFLTRPQLHPWLQMAQNQSRRRRLSQSALETVAIVAYKQPITKPEVDAIRGVDSGYVIRQLLERELITVSGRADSPGKPLLYKTSPLFLSHFGLQSVDELPKPREIEDLLRDDDMAEHRQAFIEFHTKSDEEPDESQPPQE